MEFETFVPENVSSSASEKRRTYQQASTGTVVLGAVLSVLAAAAMIIIVRYLVLVPVTDEVLENGNVNLIYGKFYQLLENLKNGSFIDDWIGNLIALVAAPLLGLFAGCMDEALCMLPLGRSIRRHIGFHVSWYTRLAPAMVFAAYMFIYFACVTINPEIHMEIENFSWTGVGYTKAMWVSQAFYLLIGLAFLILCVEAVANAGILGAVIRIPLLAVTNMVLAVLLTVIAMGAFAVIAFAFVLIVALLIFRLMAIITILNG